jgi:hypothetical protein
MKLPLGQAADEFMELRLKPGSWDRHGIPEEGCRIRASVFEKIVGQGGNLRVEDVIRGLMDWLDVTDEPNEPSRLLRTLMDRYYPADGRAYARCDFELEVGVTLSVRLGAIDCKSPVVSFNRRQWTIAVAAPAEDPGRIVVAAPGTLTLETALRILEFSHLRAQGEPFDSFAGLRAHSQKTSQFYAWQWGSVTTIDWNHGLGLRMVDGELLYDSDAYHPLPSAELWLAPNQLAWMLAIAAGA